MSTHPKNGSAKYKTETPTLESSRGACRNVRDILLCCLMTTSTEEIMYTIYRNVQINRYNVKIKKQNRQNKVQKKDGKKRNVHLRHWSVQAIHSILGSAFHYHAGNKIKDEKYPCAADLQKQTRKQEKNKNNNKTKNKTSLWSCNTSQSLIADLVTLSLHKIQRQIQIPKASPIVPKFHRIRTSLTGQPVERLQRAARGCACHIYTIVHYT